MSGIKPSRGSLCVCTCMEEDWSMINAGDKTKGVFHMYTFLPQVITVAAMKKIT